MSTYLILFTFTEQGHETILQLPERIDNAKATIEKFGGEMVSFYGALGAPFDTFVVVKAPSEEKLVAMTMAIAKLGNVRTHSFRLFEEKELKNIVQSLPAVESVKEKEFEFATA
jgi:uncharacterized protein with GYD domain